MNDLSYAIQKALETQLQSRSGESFEVIPIPAHGDKILRLRTLEELLDQFDSESDVAEGPPATATRYIVRVRTRPEPAPDTEATSAARPMLDGIYLPNGKLNVAFLMKNAEILFEAGDFALAKNVFKTIAQAGERTGVALYGMGRCLEAEGKSEEAVTHYEQAIAYQPTLESYQRLAALLLHLEKSAQAADIYERAIHSLTKEIDPDTRFELCKTAGNCWIMAQKPDRALVIFKKALELQPSSPEILSNLGTLYLQTGKPLEARRFFENAIIFCPEGGKAGATSKDKALAGLGLCSIEAGDKRAAHDYFAQSLAIHLHNPPAIFHLVKCAFELKSYATAARVLEEYIQVAPVNKNLMYSLAGLQFHLKRFSDALVTCKRTLQIAPDHAGSLELLKLIEKSVPKSG